jgi:hypothetical protein
MLTWCFVGAFLLITSRHVADDLTSKTHETASGRTFLPWPWPKQTTRLPSAWLPPRATRVEKNGSITVVDVGLSVSSLAHEFAHQRAEAAAADETLLVMTTATACDPCRGVDEALRDPRLQSALGHVRLVRVDCQAFDDDLAALRVPTDRFPGFFLLASDLTPRDGIDGGEWDDDVAANIAPVLGAFVRNKYVVRRQGFRPVPAPVITL